MLTKVPSSFSSPVYIHKHDVFLSFRGEDTRKNFIDHLYAALIRNGIATFRDDQKIEVGEVIDKELFKGIQEAWCSIIVFSKTYVFSGWCLDELVEIVQQKNKRGHKVFPIFYDVDPSELKKQIGKVEEAFVIHEERYKENKDKTQRWRCALSEVANLKGWHLTNRHESEFIKDIVKKISTKLCQKHSALPNELVGMDSRLEELHSKLEIGKVDIRIVGICGMGGIGKTTLAKVIYTQMSSYFESKSFLADVREVSKKCGLFYLQKQLLSQTLSQESFNFFNVHEGNVVISQRLSQKKVLIVIDDVDNTQHLKYLVGSRNWFGLGTRIIITTRDEHLLRSYRVDDVYKPVILNQKEALHLFCLKAFDSTFVPENDFIQLSDSVVEYANGLPLALEVLGSFLCGRNASQWRSAIERLKNDSHKEIHERLQVSFDGLEETEKNIFLDIACFFKGEDKDFVIKILDGCEFFPIIGIDVLIKKSLITINKCNKLRMHDLLQEMGRKIVKQKSLYEPGKRCRLWEESDVHQVLTKNIATERVEGLVVDYKNYEVAVEANKTLSVSAEVFLKMKKLRLLRVFGLRSSQNLTHLSNELRLFEWHGYPLRWLPSSFNPDNLVVLIVTHSDITQLLTEKRQPLNNLKFINLEGSKNLIKAPDFRMTPNLESLILEGCIKIIELHSSLGQLSSLVLLNLKDCRSLLSLPNTLDGLKSLKTLNLSGCSKIDNLPQSLQQLESLEELDLSSTAIREPESFIFQIIKNLKFLSLERCSGFSSQFQANMPSFIKIMQRRNLNPMALMLPPLSGLSSLIRLNLSDCNLGEGTVPRDICHLSSLRYLDLSGNNFINLPATLYRLSNITVLVLSNCKSLKSVHDLQTRYLRIDGCTSMESIPNVTAVCNPKETVCIYGFNCYRLVEENRTLALLKKHLKVFARKRQPFTIAIPGSEIPEYFSKDYHSNFDYYVSSSLKIPLPSNIKNDSQWIGVVLCCIFGPSFSYDSKGSNAHGRNSDEFDFYFSPDVEHVVSSEHFQLHYLLPDVFYPFLSDGERLRDEIEFCFEKFAIDSMAPNGMEFSLKKFMVGRMSPRLKKYGIKVLHEKDLEEIKDQHCYNTETCADFNGATGINAALLKHKSDIYDCEKQEEEAWSQ